MSALQFLLLETNLSDAEVVETTLTEGGIDCELFRVETRADFIQALTTQTIDLIMSDDALPGFNGVSALEIARSLCPQVPFIVVSVSVGEERVIEALTSGAIDYVLKHRLERLVPCVRRALRQAQEHRDYPFGEQQSYRNQIEASVRQRAPNFRAAIQTTIDRSQAEEALRASEARLNAVTTNLPNGAVFIVDRNLRYLLAEGKALEGAGMTSADLVGKTLWEALPPALATHYESHYRQALAGIPFNWEHCSHDRYYISHGTPLYNAVGEIDAVLVMSYDITDRKQVELNAEFLANVSQCLIGTTCVDEIVQTVGEHLHRYLKISVCAFVEINESADEAIIRHDWHQEDAPSVVGVYSLPDFVSDEFRQAAKARQTIVVQDVRNDSHIANSQRFAALKIGSFINVPLIKNNEWKFTLGVYHSMPYDWRSDEVELMRELATRIWNRIERIRAEAALRESEAKYRMLFNSMDEGYILADVIFDENDRPVDLFYVDANLAVQRLTGLDLVGKRLRQVDPSYESHWWETFSRVAQTGVGERQELYAEPLKSWYNFYVFKVGDANSRQVAAVFQDITVAKRAEEELRQKNAILNVINESAPTPIFVKDRQGRIIYANPATLDVLGKTAAEVIGYCDRDLYPNAEDAARVMENDRRIMESGQMEVVEESPDGIRTFLGMKVPYRNEAGDVIGLIGISNDITERVQIERNREQLLQQEQAAREAAEQANQIKDEFLAVLSHELRSPLNPILGWARLLQSGKLNAAQQAAALATIERNAKLQTQLIEDLLDISRIMRGKLTLNSAPVSLMFVISSAIETVRLAAEAKNIRIRLDLDSTIAAVSGDAARLQQVVWNLLSNAVKFTPTGGQISVRLRQFNYLAQIQVIDTGKGINPQFLPYVFEYFRQEDGSTTRRFGGLGLGLAIAQQIVELHGGTIYAESLGEGQGATFTVELPVMASVATIAAKSNSTGTEPAAAPLSNVRILVVDDDADTREFQAFLLQQNGAEVAAAASGLEALQVLEQFIPDVLVSDVGMAEMDGYMLMQQVRSRYPGQATIPGIALTAYAREFDQKIALEAGFQAHIAKPVEPEILVRTIVTLVSN